jgi:hypothetical protein
VDTGKFRGCLVGPIRRLVWVTAGRVPIQPARGRSPRPGYQPSSTFDGRQWARLGTCHLHCRSRSADVIASHGSRMAQWKVSVDRNGHPRRRPFAARNTRPGMQGKTGSSIRYLLAPLSTCRVAERHGAFQQGIFDPVRGGRPIHRPSWRARPPRTRCPRRPRSAFATLKVVLVGMLEAGNPPRAGCDAVPYLTMTRSGLVRSNPARSIQPDPRRGIVRESGVRRTRW